MLGAGLVGLFVLVAGVVALSRSVSLGGVPKGERLERMKGSRNFRDGKFRNLVPTKMFKSGSAGATVRDYFLGKQRRVPDAPPPVVALSCSSFAEPPAAGLRITWLGHSTTLVELDGKRVLTDPVLSERASPVGFSGPKRFHPAPIAAADLPDLDAVLISHDHYDHLDRESVERLSPKARAFYVPLGVGAHLVVWGVPAEKIVELDWWEEAAQGNELRIVSFPARHYSGRRGLDGDRSQWASFAIVGSSHRVFYSGDTGMLPTFAEVGDRFGPFDATLIKIGAYDQSWPDIHIDPEQAVQLHQLVRGRLLIPVHWATFNLGNHAWNEPAERLVAAAEKAGLAFAVPRPGQSVGPDGLGLLERWWLAEQQR